MVVIPDARCQRAGFEGGSVRVVMAAAMAAATATVVLGQGARGVSAPVFVESAAAAGLRFTHVNGASGEFFLPEQMGAGVALFDYDNDGDLDVFLVQGASMTASGGAARPSSRLFRNDLVVGTGGNSHHLFGPPLPNQENMDDTTYGVLRLMLLEGGYEWEFVPQAGGIFTDAGAGACH